MQSRTLILFLTAGALITFGGCDRHDWESTRVLHQGHGGDHGGGHGGEHKSEEGEHGKPHSNEGDHRSEGGDHPKPSKEAKPEKKEPSKGGEEKAKAKGAPRVL